MRTNFAAIVGVPAETKMGATPVIARCGDGGDGKFIGSIGQGKPEAEGAVRAQRNFATKACHLGVGFGCPINDNPRR